MRIKVARFWIPLDNDFKSPFRMAVVKVQLENPVPRLTGRCGEEGDLMTSSAAAAAARATAAWRLFQGEADVKQVRPSILPGDATKISWESKAETSQPKIL